MTLSPQFQILKTIWLTLMKLKRSLHAKFAVTGFCYNGDYRNTYLFTQEKENQANTSSTKCTVLLTKFSHSEESVDVETLEDIKNDYNVEENIFVNHSWITGMSYGNMWRTIMKNTSMVRWKWQEQTDPNLCTKQTEAIVS